MSAEDIAKHNATVEIQRGLFLFVVSLFATILLAIFAGINWQLWVTLGVFVFSIGWTFRCVHKAVLIDRQAKKNTEPDQKEV